MAKVDAGWAWGAGAACARRMVRRALEKRARLHASDTPPTAPGCPVLAVAAHAFAMLHAQCSPCALGFARHAVVQGAQFAPCLLSGCAACFCIQQYTKQDTRSHRRRAMQLGKGPAMRRVQGAPALQQASTVRGAFACTPDAPQLGPGGVDVRE